MASCGLTTGFSATCDQRKLAAGGLKGRIWLGNVDDITSVTKDSDGNITDIDFESGTGTVEVDVIRGPGGSGITASSNLSKTANGIPVYNQSVAFTIVESFAEGINFFEELANSEGLFAVVETARGQFKAFGLGVGLVATTSTMQTGPADSDSATNVTLENPQSEPPYIIFITSETATRSLVESWVYN
jgi:hypothetical protein